VVWGVVAEAGALDSGVTSGVASEGEFDGSAVSLSGSELAEASGVDVAAGDGAADEVGASATDESGIVVIP
jgi:hypothetical protein